MNHEQENTMEMTYCGQSYHSQGGLVLDCDATDGACPSCLRAHIAKLETVTAAYTELVTGIRVTETEGGALQQANNEIDRLRSELATATTEIAERDDTIDTLRNDIAALRVRLADAQAERDAGRVVPEPTGFAFPPTKRGAQRKADVLAGIAWVRHHIQTSPYKPINTVKFTDDDFVGAYETDHIRDIAKMANDALASRLSPPSVPGGA